MTRSYYFDFFSSKNVSHLKILLINLLENNCQHKLKINIQNIQKCCKKQVFNFF